MSVELRTSRLRLRCLTPEDLEDVVAGLNDWNVAQWLTRPPYPYARGDGEDYLAVMRTDHAGGRATLFAISDGADDALIGAIGIELDDASTGELGYWIARPHWGRGFAAEAASALVARARAIGLQTLTAVTDPENGRSRRVLEKTGFRAVGLRPPDRPSRRGARALCAYELSLA